MHIPGADKKRRKRRSDFEEMQMKCKSKKKWSAKDCAHPIGNMVNTTGEGEQKKCHYKTFKFHGKTYELEESVILNPGDIQEDPYVAIIKDIYVQGKEGYVKLEVQWFYRLEDVDKELVANLESKDSRDLFYSFHQDEVPAECVKYNCDVHFVPASKQIPNYNDHPGFIVQKFYDPIKKKLQNFDDKDFSKMQKVEIDLLVAKTVSQVGDLPDTLKEEKLSRSRRKQSAPKRYIMNVGRTTP